MGRRTASTIERSARFAGLPSNDGEIKNAFYKRISYIILTAEKLQNHEKFVLNIKFAN